MTLRCEDHAFRGANIIIIILRYRQHCDFSKPLQTLAGSLGMRLGWKVLHREHLYLLQHDLFSSCTRIFMFSCCSFWFHSVSAGINYQESRPVSRLWCGVPIPKREQCSSQVLQDKALLCSQAGDGTISSLCTSAALFSLCYWSCPFM